ncbi:MAG: hypothetical protein ACPLN2_05820 [Thermoproteota archaeon]
MKNFFYFFLFCFLFLVLLPIVKSTVFVYYPTTVKLSSVKPPITFKDPGTPGVTVSLGSASTSATVSVASNKALHVYDYDVNGRIVVMKLVSQSLSSGQSFSITWSAYVTNYSDPSNVGVVLQEVQTEINGNYKWFSFYYYGGNTINAGGSNVAVDVSISHTYKIVVSLSGRVLTVDFYIDSNKVNTITISSVKSIVIDSVEAGRYDVRNTYDLFIDNVNMVDVNGRVTTEDFEDGVDNFFVNSYSLGDAGKEVVYYTFPKIFLVAYNNDSNSYLAKLSITSLPSSKVSANFWIRGASTSTSIKIRNSVIVVGETSEISLSSSSNSYLYLNVTAPLTATLPLEFHLDFVYRVPNSDGVTVTYPVVVRFG